MRDTLKVETIEFRKPVGQVGRLNQFQLKVSKLVSSVCSAAFGENRVRGDQGLKWDWSRPLFINFNPDPKKYIKLEFN